MTREDINDIINAICPNDEDYEKPCISPKYLRQELEQLALDQRQWNEEPTTKNDLGVDLISRADVLKLMKDNWHTHNGDWAMQESMDDIRALPSVTPQEPRWIPVSERLPEDSNDYLVTLDGGEIYVAWFAHPKDYAIDKGEWRTLDDDEAVLAWMPLPPCYEPQESENP